MKTFFKKVSLFLLMPSLLYVQAAMAETVYKGIDAQGNTTYSDRPFKNSKEITVTLPPPAPAPPIQQKSTPVQQSAPPIAYQLGILEPHDQDTFTTDITNIVVKLALTPKLQPDDRVHLIINGQPYGSYSQSLDFTLSNFPRGAYSIQAAITSTQDPEKIITRSKAITIYQQRAIARPQVAP